MEPQSTPPHHLNESHSNAEESQHNQSRQPTPTQAVLHLDGTIQRVRAHNVVRHRLTSGLLNFALHATILLATLIIGAVLLFLNMYATDQPPWQVGIALVTFAIGGFLPAPKHKDEKTVQLDGDGNATAHRANQMVSTAQYVADVV